MRYWKVPSPAFSTSLGKFKSLKRWVTFKGPIQGHYLYQNQRGSLNLAFSPFMNYVNYELWIKKRRSTTFFTTRSKNNLFTALALIQHHPGRWLKTILTFRKKNEKPFGNKVACCSVYLDSCEDKEDSLLLTVFLWLMVLNKQLVIFA